MDNVKKCVNLKLLASLALSLLLLVAVSFMTVYATDDTPSSSSSETQTEDTTKKEEQVVEQITPDAVSSFEAVTTTNDTIKLKWDAVENATQYIIYRSYEENDGTMSKFVQYATTKFKKFKDTGLISARLYKYKICACRVTDTYTTYSTMTNLSVMTTFNSVVNTKSSDVTKSSVTLNWKKNKKATSYLVYRAMEMSRLSFSEFKLIKTVKNKTTFKDKNLSSGRIYKYKVLAQRTKKGISAVSSGTVVNTLTTLNAPKKVRCKGATSSEITLYWSKIFRADKYQIYRNNKLIATTKQNTYVVKELSDVTTYTFTVKALRTYKGKQYISDATPVTAKTVSGVYSSPDGSKTWIVVSTATQTMTMYVNNRIYVKTPVVTGNYGALATTKGSHHVMQKKSPSRLKGSYNGQSWDVTVNYWLQFTSDGQGIHDSTWRSAYGGNIYKGDGSHGCVNTPLDAMKKIYSKAYVGMLVLVQ